MSKKQDQIVAMNVILALLSIAILAFPIAAGYYSTVLKETVVITAESSDLYQRGYIFSEDIPYPRDIYSGRILVYDEPVNDSYMQYYYHAGNNEIALFNSVTTIGNTSIVSDFNYSVLSVNPQNIGFRQDITTHNLTQYDFVEIWSNDDKHGGRGIAWANGASSIHYLNGVSTGNNTCIVTIDLFAKTLMLSEPDANIYLVYVNPDITESDWSFELSYWELSDTIWSWDDFQLAAIASVIAIALIWIALVFGSETFETIRDRNRKDRK